MGKRRHWCGLTLAVAQLGWSAGCTIALGGPGGNAGADVAPATDLDADLSTVSGACTAVCAQARVACTGTAETCVADCVARAAARPRCDTQYAALQACITSHHIFCFPSGFQAVECDPYEYNHCVATAPDGGLVGSAADVCTPAPAADGGVCNAVPSSGFFVTTECRSGAAPAPSGGTILDGEYVLTDALGYGRACEPVSSTETLVFSGNRLQSRRAAVESSGRGTFTYSTSGSTLTLTQTCPSRACPVDIGYDATATDLVLYRTSADGRQTTVATYLRL